MNVILSYATRHSGKKNMSMLIYAECHSSKKFRRSANFVVSSVTKRKIALSALISDEKQSDSSIKGEPQPEKSDPSSSLDANEVIPVLMFACNRVTVNVAIDSLLKARKNPKQFPIIVSQVF
jgi:hypothetical protein